jgi:hypothetical protein
MDRQSLDYDNPAKRRRLDNQVPEEGLFMSQSPVSDAKNEDSSMNDFLDVSDDDSNDGELDEPGYEESEESFPDHPAFKPAVKDLNARAETAVQKLYDALEQYASVNDDLRNMLSKTAVVLESRAGEPLMVALLGGTAAGKLERID